VGQGLMVGLKFFSQKDEANKKNEETLFDNQRLASPKIAAS